MFFDRLQLLCAENDVKDVSGLLKALGLSTSKGTAWKNGSIPKGDILLKIASYFRVSTDYLLGNTDDPSPSGQKEKPVPLDEDGLSETKYRQLTPENQEFVNSLIEKLLKSQSSD